MTLKLERESGGHRPGLPVPAMTRDGLRLRPGDQPLPTRNGEVDVQSQVIQTLRTSYDLTGINARIADDVAARRELGIQRYGTALQPHNGRDVLRDLLDELVDGMVYARQARLEGHDLFEDVELSLRHLAWLTTREMDRRNAKAASDG